MAILSVQWITCRGDPSVDRAKVHKLIADEALKFFDSHLKVSEPDNRDKLPGWLQGPCVANSPDAGPVTSSVGWAASGQQLWQPSQQCEGLREQFAITNLSLAFFTEVTTRAVEVATHLLGKPLSCARSCLGSLFCPVPGWCVRRKRAEKVAGDCCYLSNGSKERSFVGFRWLVEAADLSHEL